MLAFEDIKPGSRLRGLDPAGVAEVVQVARFGSDALNLVFRVNGRVGERLVYRGEEAAFRVRSSRSALRVRCGRRPAAACVRSLPHPARPPVRSLSGRQRFADRGAAAPDHRRLRRDAAAPAAALPARRRPRRRQDDHGRAADQGAADPRRPGTLPDRGARRPRRAVAGGNGREVRPRTSTF